MNAPETFANYRALLAKVDAKHAEISGRVGERMRCGRGCHGCCAPGLSVSSVERAHLAAHVAASPGLKAELEALDAEDPHAGARCSFLRANGDCAVYEARPIICRSHGLPLEVREPKAAPRRDVCPLNFAGEDLTALAGDDVLNLQLLDTLLALIDGKHREASGAKAERTALRVAAITSAST